MERVGQHLDNAERSLVRGLGVELFDVDDKDASIPSIDRPQIARPPQEADARNRAAGVPIRHAGGRAKLSDGCGLLQERL